MPFDSEDRRKHIKAGVMAADAFLLGKVTYKMLASYWSPLPDDAEGGLAGELNNTPKFVVSSKLKKADWKNSTSYHLYSSLLLDRGSASLVRNH